jgi:succinoglycan biosynthesis protein ExoW
MTPFVAVVIPFYQREPGLLAVTLQSVAAQTARATIRIVVIDDASPVPARPEVEAARALGLDIHLIEQPNAGPGGARNAGLGWAAEVRADLVAFLDSDDRWRPAHLERALRALSAGDDVYFSNFIQLGADRPAFERAGRLAREGHRPIDESGGLWHYVGDMLTQVVTGNLIGTPAVVYRVQKFADHRFRPEFRRAGEDYLFWMGLAARGATFCFGTEPMVDCGRGINIFSGAGWGTDGFARRLYDEVSYRLVCEREFALTPIAREHARSERRRLAKAFVRDFLHRVRHRKRLDWRLSWAFVNQLMQAGR